MHIDPVLHDETLGWFEGCGPPAQSSTTRYQAAYADVEADGMNPLPHDIVVADSGGRTAFTA